MTGVSDVDPRLAAKLASQLNVTPRQVNRLIDNIVREMHLTRQQAAIVLAGRRDVNFSRFATPEDLAAVRSSGGIPAASTSPKATSSRAAAIFTRTKGAKLKKQPGNSVFVVHGRNETARRDLFRLLRDLGLNPN